MSEYFDPPQSSGGADQWSPPPGQTPATVWSSSGGPPIMGADLWRAERPRPLLSVLVGVVGGLLLTLGTVVLLSKLSGEGDSAAVVAGLLVALGVAALVVALPRLPSGSTTAAGVTAAFLLAAAPMGFWLQTADSIGFKTAASLFILVPTAVWAACFLVGSTRGRPVFLAGALAGLWLLLSVLVVDTDGSSSFDGARPADVTLVAAAQETPEDVDGDGIPDQFDPDFVDPNGTGSPDQEDTDGDGVPDSFDPDPFNADDGSGSEGTGVEFGSGDEAFDPTTIVPSLFPLPFFFGVGSAGSAMGVIALLFGVGYLAVAAMLDRSERAGSATPFQGVGIVALLTAVSALGSDLGDVATSIAVVALGAALLWLGVTARRRLSAWLGTLLAAGGALSLVASIVEDEVPAGVLLVLLGLGVVAAAQVVLADVDDDVESDDALGAGTFLAPPPMPPEPPPLV